MQVVRAAPGGAVRHHQAAQRRTRATTTALRAYDDSCERLGLEQIDLYLVHWPNPVRGPLRRQLAGAGAVLRGAAGPGDRGLQLPARAPGAAGRRDRAGAGRQPDRAAPDLPAARRRRLRRPSGPSRSRRTRRSARVPTWSTRRWRPSPSATPSDAGPDRAALARATRSHRDPEIEHARSHPVQLRRLRLLVDRRRTGLHHRDGERQPDRRRSAHVRTQPDPVLPARTITKLECQ